MLLKRSQPKRVESASFWGPPTCFELKTHNKVKPHKEELENNKADEESVGFDSEVERDGIPNPNLSDTPTTTAAASRNTSAESLSPLAMLGKGKEGSVRDDPKEKELIGQKPIKNEEKRAKADERTVNHDANRRTEAIAQADLILRKTPLLETKS
ncbi:MAG: hypothetical protein M1824_001074 [Vezdaea acicularis]|nr:MAG: hypothetical protein M1824_001074 [Vezdaea acicularis]